MPWPCPYCPPNTPDSALLGRFVLPRAICMTMGDSRAVFTGCLTKRMTTRECCRWGQLPAGSAPIGPTLRSRTTQVASSRDDCQADLRTTDDEPSGDEDHRVADQLLHADGIAIHPWSIPPEKRKTLRVAPQGPLVARETPGLPWQQGHHSQVTTISTSVSQSAIRYRLQAQLSNNSSLSFEWNDSQ